MTKMKKKRQDCKYCGEKMEAKTTRKEFCSPKCKVYWHREGELKSVSPKEEKVKHEEEKRDLSDTKKNLSDVKVNSSGYPADDPKEGSMAFFKKYGYATYEEIEKALNNI